MKVEVDSHVDARAASQLRADIWYYAVHEGLLEKQTGQPPPIHGSFRSFLLDLLGSVTLASVVRHCNTLAHPQCGSPRSIRLLPGRDLTIRVLLPRTLQTYPSHFASGTDFSFKQFGLTRLLADHDTFTIIADFYDCRKNEKKN